MKKYVNGQYIDITEEEIAKSSAIGKTLEKHRKMSVAEVNRMLIEAQINSLDVDDDTALKMIDYYPEWKEGVEYSANFKVKRNSKLYKTRQAHTSQITWEPENVPSLWEVINETYAGTIDEPVPYDGNMALENGKYYLQDYEIYLCTRDTVNPVYHALADLVGLYIEKVY